MKKTLFQCLLAAILLLTLDSCMSNKKIIYLQGADVEYILPKAVEQAFELKIEPDDQLAISVASKDRELIEPFNNNTLIGGGNNGNYSSSTTNTTSGVSYFHVDAQGYIAFPVFGQLKVGGKTTNEVSVMVQKLLREGDASHAPFIKDAVVNTKIMSFKVTVLGDVKNSGQQTYQGERLTLLEAIGRAGDLNASGRREPVLVIREENGQRVTYNVDLRDQASVFQSPAYYLQQNDVIYVQPNKSQRIKTSTGYTWLSASSTLVGIIVSIVSLIVAINK